MLTAKNLSEEVKREIPSTGGMYARNGVVKRVPPLNTPVGKKQSILMPITRLLKRGMKMTLIV